MDISTPRSAPQLEAALPAVLARPVATLRTAGPWSRAGRRLRRNRFAISGAALQLAFPGILAALVIVTVLGSGLDKAMIAVGIGGIPRYARIVRGSVLDMKNELFVLAARSIGASDGRIMFAHVLPHALGPVITLATLGLGTAILSSASLSFLGLGAQTPTAEWGLMLSDGRKYLRVAWWLCVIPGVAIAMTVLAINLLGDGVRDALDPHLRTRED